MVEWSHHIVTEEDERPPADDLSVAHGQTGLQAILIALPRRVRTQQLGAGQAVSPGDGERSPMQ